MAKCIQNPADDAMIGWPAIRNESPSPGRELGWLERSQPDRVVLRFEKTLQFHHFDAHCLCRRERVGRSTRMVREQVAHVEDLRRIRRLTAIGLCLTSVG